MRSNDDSERVSGPGAPKPAQSQLAKLAARQWGVVSLAQLESLGLSYDDVKGRVERSQLHRLHSGVYAVGHTSLVRHAHLLAALLATGPDSFLSHRTAAAVWGLRPVNLRQIEVTVATGHVTMREGLTLHRTGSVPHRDEVRDERGLRVSSVPRMLLELAPTEKPDELSRLITVAARKSLLNVDRIEEALQRHPRRPGLAKLKAAVEGYRPRPDRKSDLERDCDVLLRKHPEIPDPQRNVKIAGWELDYHWPASGLAVELDGRPYHQALADMEKDKLKDCKLLRLGIKVLRITDWRLREDTAGVLDDLRTLTMRPPGSPPAARRRP